MLNQLNLIPVWYLQKISNPLLSERSMNSRIKVLDCSQVKVLKLLNSNGWEDSLNGLTLDNPKTLKTFKTSR